MMGIGYYAYLKSTSDMSRVHARRAPAAPRRRALSAGASDMSGWMLMGLPGAIFVAGFSAVWIAVGLVIGAYSTIAW
jgi:SSS family solute:Na+ symporter